MNACGELSNKDITIQLENHSHCGSSLILCAQGPDNRRQTRAFFKNLSYKEHFKRALFPVYYYTPLGLDLVIRKMCGADDAGWSEFPG